VAAADAKRITISGPRISGSRALIRNITRAGLAKMENPAEMSND
jgi:hypothetical protein